MATTTTTTPVNKNGEVFYNPYADQTANNPIFDGIKTAIDFDWEANINKLGDMVLDGLKYIASQLELYYIGSSNNDTMLVLGVGGNVLAKEGNDSIWIGAAYADVYAGDGNDTIGGATAALTVYDKGGNLTVNGVAGYASIRKYASGDVTFNGLAGYNTILMREGIYTEPGEPNAFQKFIAKIYATISEPLIEVGKAVVNFFDNMGQVFKQAFTVVINTFSSWNNFASALDKALDSFVNFWKDVVDSFDGSRQYIEYGAYKASDNSYSWTTTDVVTTAATNNPYIYKWADDKSMSNYKFYFDDYGMSLPYQYALDKMLFGGSYNSSGDWVGTDKWIISGVDYAGVVFEDVSYRVRQTDTQWWGLDSKTFTVREGTRKAAVLFTDRREFYRYKYHETTTISNGLSADNPGAYSSETAWTPPEMSVLIATLAHGYRDWLANGNGASVSQVYLRALYAVVNNLSYAETTDMAAVNALTENQRYNLQGGAETAIESFGSTYLKTELRQGLVDMFVQDDADAFLREWIANTSGTLASKLNLLANAGAVFNEGMAHRIHMVNGSTAAGVNYVDSFRTYMLGSTGVNARQLAHEDAYRADLRNFSQRTGMDLTGALKLMGISVIDGNVSFITNAVSRLLRAYELNRGGLGTLQAWVDAANLVTNAEAMWRGKDLAELEAESGLYSLGVRIGGESWNGNPKYEIYADNKLVASGEVTWAVAASGKKAVDFLGTSSAWKTIWFNVEALPSTVEVRLVNDGWGGNDSADRNLFVDKLYLSADQTQSVDFAKKDLDAGSSTATLPLETATTMGIRLGGESYLVNPQYEIYADGQRVASGTITWAVAASDKSASAYLGTDGAWRTIWFNVATRPSQIEVRLVQDVNINSSDRDLNLFVDKLYLSKDSNSYVSFTNKDVTLPGAANSVKITVPSAKTAAPTLLSSAARDDLLSSVVQESIVSSNSLALDMVTTAQLLYGETRVIGTRMGVRMGGEHWGGNPAYQIYADGKLVASGSVSWAVPASFKTAADWAGTDSAWQTVWFDVTSRPAEIEVRLTNDAYGGTPDRDRNLFVDKLYLSTDTNNYVSFAQKDIGTNGSGNKINLNALGLGGLLAAYEANSATNLVTNGSFENPTDPNAGWARTYTGTVANLNRSGNDIAGISAAQGSTYYELASDKNATVYQDITTRGGQWYTLSFRYRPQTGDAIGNGMQIWWNGQLLDSLAEDDGEWRTYTYRVKATGSSTRLAFAGVGTSDGIGALLDDVKLGYGIDIIDYTINQALTANAALGGVIQSHWQKHVGNALLDNAAILAKLKSLNGNIDAMKAVLETYASGYAEALIKEAGTKANDNNQTLQALITAYGSVAGDGNPTNNTAKTTEVVEAIDDNQVDKATVTEIDKVLQEAVDSSDTNISTVPAGASYGNAIFNGAAGYNSIYNDFLYGDIRFKGAAGYNKLRKTGISGNISFYGVGGGNLIQHRATDGNIKVVADGIYNEIERTGKSGNVKAILIGAYNKVVHNVDTGNLDIRAFGAGNYVSRTGTGIVDAQLLGIANIYEDDGKSNISVYGFGGLNKITRNSGTDSKGTTKLVLGGGGNVVNIKNNGTVNAQLYGGYNQFTYTGSEHVKLILGGQINVATIGDGGSNIKAFGQLNIINTGSGRDVIRSYGLFNVINSGGSRGVFKDYVEVWGSYNDVNHGLNDGDAVVVNNSLIGGLSGQLFSSSALNISGATRLSTTNAKTVEKYGAQESNLSSSNLSGAGATLSEQQEQTRSADAPLTTAEKNALKEKGVDMDARMETIKTSNADSDANHQDAYVTKNADGTYKAVNDNSAGAKNFDVNTHKTSEHSTALKARDSGDLRQASKDDKNYGVQTENSTNEAGPVVLDMNGNGTLDLTALGENDDIYSDGYSSGIEFDITGDGKKETVAWVGKGGRSSADGILFYDKDSNLNTVTASEMVFADSASETDMQGLARKYDTNKDKLLQGSELNGFYVWQDNNLNGTVEAGEVRSVQEAGITEIGVDTSHTRGAESREGNRIYRTNDFRMNGGYHKVGDVGLNYSKVETNTALWFQFKDQLKNYDNFYLGMGLASIIDLGAADDAIVAISAYNQVKTGAGNDFVLALALANNIQTGTGDDIGIVGGVGNYVNLGAGNDTAFVTGFANWIDTGSGNDTVIALGAFGLPAGVNIVCKLGDGDLTAILGSTANVLYNRGNGNISGMMLGAVNIVHKDGAGSVSMFMLGAASSVSQKGSVADDRFMVIMAGALNVATHIGRGDYYAVMVGLAGISTNVSEGGAAEEVVIMAGVANVHTTVGATDRSMYFLFGVYNVLTKVSTSNDYATGDTWAIMYGMWNVATLITQGTVNAIFIGFYNVVTRVGGTGADRGFAAIFVGNYNIVTNVADGADAVAMLGAINIFTKVGDGDSTAIMVGQGNVFTKVGNGDNLVVMGGLLGNLFTHVGKGNTLALLVSINAKFSANVFTKWGDGDTAVILAANPGVDGKAHSINLMLQIGNGRTFSMAVGWLNAMIKVGHGDYSNGWGSTIDTSGVTNLSGNSDVDIATELNGVVQDGLGYLSPAMANKYFNVVMGGFGANNIMAEINLKSFLKGYTDSNGKAIDALTYTEKQTSTLQIAIAYEGLGNVMVKAGDGLYIGLAITIKKDFGDIEQMNAIARAALALHEAGQIGLLKLGTIFNSVKKRMDVLPQTSKLADLMAGNLAVNIGDGDAIFVMYGKNNVAVKVGDGGIKAVQFGTNNVLVRIGDAADTPLSVDIGGYKAGQGAMMMMGRYNINVQYGKSNDLIIAVPRINEMPKIDFNKWFEGFEIKLTQGETKWQKALDGAMLITSGGSFTHYKSMWESVKELPDTLRFIRKGRTPRSIDKTTLALVNSGEDRWQALKDMWKIALDNIQETANVIHAGRGADIILAYGNTNIIFADNATSILDISLASLVTYDWQYTSWQQFAATIPTTITLRITAGLNTLAEGFPGGGIEFGFTMPDKSMLDLFSVSYNQDGSVSDETLNLDKLRNELLGILAFEPSFNFGSLNSGVTALYSTLADGIGELASGTTSLDNKAKEKLGIGSYADAWQADSLDAYSSYATYNFDRVFKGNMLVSSFPHLGFLAYMFSEIDVIGKMIWEEATDDLVSYFKDELHLLSDENDADVVITVGEANIVFTGHGDDLLLSMGALTRAWGGYGDDIAVLLGGYNSFQGNDGSDVMLFIGVENLGFGDAGNDFLAAVGTRNHLAGGADNDVIIAIGSKNRLKGGGGNDIIIAIGDSNTILAGDGDDFILVMGYKNTYYTGGGRDTIINIGNTRTAAWIAPSDMDGDQDEDIVNDDKADAEAASKKYIRTRIGGRTKYTGAAGVDVVVMLGQGDRVIGKGNSDIFVLAYGARVDNLRAGKGSTLVLGDVAGFGSQKIAAADVNNWFTFTKDADDLRITIADKLGIGGASIEIENVFTILGASEYRPNVVLSYWATDTSALLAQWATASAAQQDFTFTYDYMYVDAAKLYDFIKDGRTDWANIVSYGSAANGTGFTMTHTARMGVGLGLMGGKTVDSIIGTTGDDVLCGYGGNDTIDGYAGDDLMSGNEGNDTFIAGLGNDAIAGGNGTDIVNYTNIAAKYNLADSAIRIELTQSSAGSTDYLVRIYKTSDNSLLKTDKLTSIETITLAPAHTTTIPQVNRAPTYGTTTFFNTYEGMLAVGTALFTDADNDRLYYSIVASDSDDSSLFTLDAETGLLSFKTAPIYYGPGSLGGDNYYFLTVKAIDALGGVTTQQINIRVLDDMPVFIPDLNTNRIYGTAGNDNLIGDIRDNVFLPGAGVDTINGGEGYDTVSYVSATEGYYVLLSDYAGQSYSLPVAVMSTRTLSRTQRSYMTSIENIVGSAYDDKLVGNSEDNFIIGGTGADIIHGMGGNDTISYADAKTGYRVVLEAIEFQDGQQVLTRGYSIATGSRGREDYLYTIENIIGTDYNDILVGNILSNVLVGGGGVDVLAGNGGGDTYYFVKSAADSFGRDVITYSGVEGDGDEIQIVGTAVDAKKVWFSKIDGDDLSIEFVGSNDAIRIVDWFVKEAKGRIDRIYVNNKMIAMDTVDRLVTAMANVVASYGGDVTGSDYLGVNPNTDNATLASLVASSWVQV